MAIMIPEKPRDFDPLSREDIMFSALEALPDEYYVVHSFQVNKIRSDDSLYEGEADFVIFHPRKGILCLEAKATKVRYEGGDWLYGSGKKMHSGGPFKQANRAMHAVKDYMLERGMDNLVDHCKFLFAVWFPLVSDDYVRRLILPPDAPKELIMAEEALYNPEYYLDRIFGYTDHDKTETTISDAMASRIVNEVLCPQFEIAPSLSFDTDTKHMLFHRLLKEQAAILNFLEEQKTAVINGAAGTGKTLVAVEKAKRHALRGEKVLFLCFNRQLRDHLEKSSPNENIDYETVARFACRLCHTAEPDYAMLNHLLESMWENGSFPYQHVIVDEGQDFGSAAVEEAGILETLRTIIEDTKEDGSFYVFYDKLQLVQARQMPRFLAEADCKLTLYRNCRNTENIAKTSLRPITERNPKLMENCIVGVPAKLHFCPDTEAVPAAVDDALDTLLGDGIKDIVILTCKKENESCLAPYVESGFYPTGRESIRFTTCRKYKGLEADAIILVDVEENTFVGNEGQNVLLYYVGTSRARLRLDIMTTMNDDGCVRVLESLGKSDRIKRPQRDLARALNAIPVIEED